MAEQWGWNSLNRLQERLGEVTSALNTIRPSIRDIPFVGEPIEDFVFGVVYKLSRAREELIGFRDKYGWLIDAVLERIVEGEVLSALDMLWPDFYWFRIDPQGMIRWWLTQGVSGLETFLLDPGGWLQAAFDYYTSGLSEFLRNPKGWLESWLMEVAPILYYVVRGEWGFVNEAIYQMHPWTRYIFDDWREWLRFRVGDILGVEYRFWFDPVGYIKEYVIEARDDWMHNSAEWILAILTKIACWIISGEWNHDISAT